MMHFASDPCKPKWLAAAQKGVPETVIAKRGLSDVSVNAAPEVEGETTHLADTQVPPVDTKPPKPKRTGDRHKPGYIAKYLREVYRPSIKAKKEAAKAREELKP